MAKKINTPSESSQETVHPNPARAESDATESAAIDLSAKESADSKVSDAVVKIGKSILRGNPQMSVVYMTSDGQAFYQKNDAELHARSLKNKAVTPVKK